MKGATRTVGGTSYHRQGNPEKVGRMNWPWKSEKRNDSYTDLLVSYALSRANATGAAPAATGALEAASGIVSRCFAAADVSAPDHAQAALGPGFFSQVGRALIRSGKRFIFSISKRRTDHDSG